MASIPKPPSGKRYVAGLRYFYAPTSCWFAMRIYETLDAAVEDYLALFAKPEICAVRLYIAREGRRFPDDMVWEDEKVTGVIARHDATAMGCWGGRL